MKKTLQILALSLLGILSNAQVGINTENPQQVFHIDGQKDNPGTGTPNSTQQANDFVVTESGNIGAGVVNPTEKVDVNGNVKFNGTLQPNGNTGTMGQVLTSQGSASSPIWITTSVVPVVATVKTSITMNFPNNVTQQLDFDIIEQNTWGGVNLSNNTITINQEGDYLLQGQLGFAGSQILNNGVVIYIYINGIERQRMQAPAGDLNNTLVAVVGIHHLMPGDIITVLGRQSNGDNRVWDPQYFRFSVAKM